MKKSFQIGSFLLPSIFIILFVSCGQKPNYEMRSQQNSLHQLEIIYFDSISEQSLGPFPLDRSYYSRILAVIEQSSPKYVILKFFFDSETDSDEGLSQQLKKYGNVLTQSTSLLEPLHVTSQQHLDEISITLGSRRLPEIETMILPNPSLFESFEAVGHVDFETRNGEYLNCPLAVSVSGRVIPSLALRIGMMISESVPIWFDDSITLNGISLSDKSGRFCLSLSEPKGLYPTYSFVDVLESKPDKYDFRDKIVIVFVDNASIRNISSGYEKNHNPAEIVADSINSVLLRIQ